jgi:16S rRNA (cytosine967-C5)-methyltransferase
MHAKALLAAQTELVRRVLRFEQPADRVLADYVRGQRGLGPRERGTLADGVFALLRTLALCRHLAAFAEPPGTPERRLAILSWQGSDAALRTALDPEELAWLERARAVDVGALALAIRRSLPDWLAPPMEQRLGAEVDAWAAANEQAAPLDLRVNALKADRDEALRQLAASAVDARPTPFSPLGIRVVGKPGLQKHVIFERGLVEAQDEGSQLLALAVGARRGEIVVDFCAGAGGKTLALGAQMRNTGRLYAFDVSAHRLAALQPRLERSGLANVHPARIAHERDERVERLAGKADRVLVDAPCSGSGTLRRHPDLKWRQVASIDDLVRQQRAILAAAARLVKPGGRLVYATCSVLEAEGEGVADAFERDAGAAFTRVAAVEALAGAKVAQSASLVEGDRMRLWTHRHGTDGFFAAIWQRA